MKITSLRWFAAFVLFNTIPLFSTFAQTTAFTYQGRLLQNGNPANGSYSFQFRLIQVNTGQPQGPILTNQPVTVSNGLFTTVLDFGDYFGERDFNLEIGVRTNGGGAFTILANNQPVLSTPLAIVANRALTFSGTLPVAQLNGTVPAAQLPASVVMNNGTGLTLSGTFSGNGSGLNNVNAATLNGLDATNFWQMGGNNVAGGQFLGSTNQQPVEIRVGGQRAQRYEFGGASAAVGNGVPTGAPNVIGGSSVNFVAPGVVGAVIGGGGATNYYGFLYANSIGGGSDFSFLGGGYFNFIQAGAYASFLGGGGENSIQMNTRFSFLGGGAGNSIQPYADYSFLGGGYNNSIQPFAYESFLGGGVNNSIHTGAYDSFLGGGVNNSIQTNAHESFLGGGYNNSIYTNARLSVIGGGGNNVILPNGAYAVIPGGSGNSAANSAFAAGTRAKAVHDGSFVWADSQQADFTSTATNQFSIRAKGGIRISDDTANLSFGSTTRQMLNLYGTSYGLGVQNATLYFRCDTNASGSPFGGFRWYQGGVHNDANGNAGAGGTELMSLGSSYLYVNGTFVSSSDRNVKENFADIKPSEVLAKVAALPITSWNYKTDTTSRHLGPMAQDFYAAFGVGPDDKHITTVDESGVALAAIQGLNEKLGEARMENEELKQRTETLERRLEILEGIIRNQTH